MRAASQVVADAAVVPVLESSLSMPAGGIVQEVLVAEGDTVEAGQPLLRLRSLSQQAAVAQAEAGVAQAQARVDELKAGPRPEEITVAQAAVDTAAAQLDRLSAGARAEDIAASQAALDGARASLQKAQEGGSAAADHCRNR